MQDLNSPELHERLRKINDRKEFADEIYKLIVENRAQALLPIGNTEERLLALKLVSDILEEYEEYEKCAFIRDLIIEAKANGH